MFCLIRQNNSGGYFLYDVSCGVGEYIAIEFNDEDDVYYILDKIEKRFNMFNKKFRFHIGANVVAQDGMYILI